MEIFRVAFSDLLSLVSYRRMVLEIAWNVMKSRHRNLVTNIRNITVILRESKFEKSEIKVTGDVILASEDTSDPQRRLGNFLARKLFLRKLQQF